MFSSLSSISNAWHSFINLALLSFIHSENFCCIYYLQLIILVVALGLCYRFLACRSLPSSDSALLRVYYDSLTVVSVQFSSVQSLSRVRLFATPWIAAHQASLSIRLTSIESVMPSSHLILCCPLLLRPPIPLSIRVFSNESTLCMRCPKYWSFSFSIIPSKEIPGLISFRMDWLDLLAVQGTLKSLLQHHSSKHQFFSAQLSSQFNSRIDTWPLEKP